MDGQWTITKTETLILDYAGNLGKKWSTMTTKNIVMSTASNLPMSRYGKWDG